MSLRVLALSAPQFVTGAVGEKALSSSDPASLFNACRVAAEAAAGGDPWWGSSNWAVSRRGRRATARLFHDLPEAEFELDRLLPVLQPNLVLIGAMSICMPGAIACAEIVRAHLGDDVLIVLGGRHTSETMWADKAGVVRFHRASPLQLMANERIAAVFDVVVSGDAEAVIVELGRMVGRVVDRKQKPRSVRFDLDALKIVEGEWCAGTVVQGRVMTVVGQAGPLIVGRLPSPTEMFGVTTSFDVFNGAKTAHVFSDIGRGCVYDCGFCSERISVTGAPRQFETSPDRLHANLMAAHRTIKLDDPAASSSAFVEDSTFLGWNARLIDRFETLVNQEPLGLRYGGQATVDQIIQRPDLARRLRRLGFEYVFVGIETPDPTAIGGISKDIGYRREPWLTRARRMLDVLGEADIKLGVSLLFGLGESKSQREMLLKAVADWKANGELSTISMNWAVQHPLRGDDAGLSYEYIDWALEPGPLLDVMRHFGEASTRYTISGGTAPTLSEASEIVAAVDQILARNSQTQEVNHG
jgi:B12-binding domain/radical SAM domain protein